MLVKTVLYSDQIITIWQETSFGETYIKVEVPDVHRAIVSAPFEHWREQFPDATRHEIVVMSLNHCIVGMSVFDYQYKTPSHSIEDIVKSIRTYMEQIS